MTGALAEGYAPLKRISGAGQVILEESSHLPFWEERNAYMAAVGDFLRRHD